MHATDTLAHRSGLLVARAAADASGTGVAKPQAVIAEVRPTEAECVAYLSARAPSDFTVPPPMSAAERVCRQSNVIAIMLGQFIADQVDANDTECLHEDDGA